MSLAGPTTANKRHNPLYIELFSDQKLLYTSGDHIHGVLRVEPSVRPINISIFFRGFSLIYDSDATGIRSDFFEFSQELFVSTGAGENFDILRKGTAEDGKVELPFDFTFPLQVKLPPPGNRNWWYSKDAFNHPRFQHSPGFILPPSCAQPTSAAGLLFPKIIYCLEAHMESMMSDTSNTRVRRELKFIPPAPDYHPGLLQPDLNFGPKLPEKYCRYKFIRSRKLLPGYSEGSKLGRVKDALGDKQLFLGLTNFTEIPFARFNFFATPARVLIIGSRVPITVTVEHLDRSQSLPDPPSLFMRRLRVQLVSTLSTFVPTINTTRNAGKETVTVAKDTMVLVDRKFETAEGEPLYNRLNILDLAEVRLSEPRLLPSFTSYGQALEYELQVDIDGECAGRDFTGIACRERVQIVSGWHAPPALDIAGGIGTESRPEYHEVDPLAFGQDTMTRPSPNGLRPITSLHSRTSAFELTSESMDHDQGLERLPPPPYAG
ncbi:hypothetical protein IQ07DRAFT_645812 [Pyrenochaeta sp. DS3sAY3a]|nr:hypothetical protein IQ07DRAFT_645812 [Pyrenochaeta sp. DS3sAY3a]